MSYFKQQREQLLAFFEQHAQAAAAESGFSQRRSKLDGVKFAQGLVLGWLEHPDASLEQLAQGCSRLGIRITRQGVDARIQAKAVLFLGLLFGRGLRHFQSETLLKPGVLERFTALYILDSTQLQLPSALRAIFQGNGADQASVKIQHSFEYFSGQIAALEWSDGRQPDQTCRLHQQFAQPGSLHLFDLGYFKQQVLEWIAQHGAFFISRLQSQTAVYSPDGERLELAELVSRLPAIPHQQAVQIGRLTHLPVRLICVPVSPTVAANRRRHAKARARKQHQTCSQAHLALKDWELFVTNVPDEWLSLPQILAVYRLRWQIELCFKVWKSQCHLACFGAWRPERVFCQLYARFIGILLCHWLFAPARLRVFPALSLPKAVHVLRQLLPDLRRALAHAGRGLLTCLHQLGRDLVQFAAQDQRTKSPSSLDALLALA